MGFLGTLGNIISGAGSVLGMIPGVGSVAGGIANAIGGALGSSMQTSDAQEYQQQMAEQNHKWQSEENEKNRQWQSDEWTRQFDMNNAYNNPSAVAKRLRLAGINPQVAFENGTSQYGSGASPSAPSGASGMSPSPDYSHVLTAGYQNMQSLFKNLEIINNARKSGIENEYLGAKLDAETQKILTDMRLTDIQSKAQEFAFEIEKQFGRLRASKVLRKLEADAIKSVNEAWLAVSQGNYYDNAALTQSVMALVEYAKKHNLETEGNILEERLKWLPQELQAEIDRKRSESVKNRAEAAHSAALAKTEDVFRGLRKGLLENDLKFNTETYYDRVDQLRESLDSSILHNQQVKETLERLKFSNSIKEFDYWYNQFLRTITTMLSGVPGRGSAGDFNTIVDAVEPPPRPVSIRGF